jgi:ABC-type nitrate/sulfonate/bicarbonate transport system substrate-binding protein
MKLLLSTLAMALMTSAVSAQSLTIALDWTPNTNHIGLYVAEALGYYDEAGLAVDILPYSDTASGTLVANGVADFAVLSAVAYFTQKAAGADLLATYAVVQSETGRVVFLADRNDIQTPKDLDGLTYGGFGSAWEDALISTIIEADGGTGEFETVTLGTSAYDALANGSVDFTLEVYTWEGVKAERDGPAQRAFRYADYGVPDQHTTFIGARSAWLAENAETAAAFTKATRAGYAYAVENPGEAADILVAASNGFLTDRDFVKASLDELIEGNYLRSADGVVGTIDPAKIEAIGSFFFDADMLRDGNGTPLAEKPDFSAWFSNAYLGE